MLTNTQKQPNDAYEEDDLFSVEDVVEVHKDKQELFGFLACLLFVPFEGSVHSERGILKVGTNVSLVLLQRWMKKASQFY